MIAEKVIKLGEWLAWAFLSFLAALVVWCVVLDAMDRQAIIQAAQDEREFAKDQVRKIPAFYAIHKTTSGCVLVESQTVCTYHDKSGAEKFAAFN